MPETHTRRGFLSLLLAMIGISAIPNNVFAGSVHPEPREGIDASLVIPDEKVS